MKPYAELVTIGRVVKPQGRKGELLTEPLSDVPGRFSALTRAFVPAPDGSAREVRITACWPHKGRFVLKLEGVDSISDAEAYRGLELRIAPEELAPLPAGSYYHHDLVGMTAEDTQGHNLGTVSAVWATGGTPVLVIVGPQGETLIPLASDFLASVDVTGRRLVVRVPEMAESRAH